MNKSPSCHHFRLLKNGKKNSPTQTVTLISLSLFMIHRKTVAQTTAALILILTLSLLLQHSRTAHAQNQTTALAAARTQLSQQKGFAPQLASAALERTTHTVRYDPAYVKLTYPGGDVPADTGVCTDEVIRSYRTLGHDLQKLVHQDMAKHFSQYPKNWGLSTTDKNIDHRRVPNLQTFFKRQGAALPITQNPAHYLPGDIVTCTVAGKLPHIMLVVPPADNGTRPWVVHNIGSGPKWEDQLFAFPLTGHYRWHPRK
jgi:uncharacterized protein